MRDRRLEIIYNPLAGPANLDDKIEEVGDFWRDLGWQVAVRATQYAGHAVNLARAAADARVDLVLAAGGDGTLGEVANGLATSSTIMGVLPIGTGNSFAKELRLPRPSLVDHEPLLEAASLLAKGRVHAMDVGRFADGKYWLLWVGTGVDSYIVDQMEPRSKLSKRLGPVGYVAQALAVAPTFPPMEARIELDDQVFEGTFVLVLVSNCRRFAGGEVMLNPEARLDDGEFELFMFRGHGFSRIIRYLWAVWRGTHQNSPDVTVARGRRLHVETARTMPVHSDGDPAAQTPFTCRLEPGALRLLVPRTAPAGLFSGPGTALP